MKRLFCSLVVDPLRGRGRCTDPGPGKLAGISHTLYKVAGEVSKERHAQRGRRARQKCDVCPAANLIAEKSTRGLCAPRVAPRGAVSVARAHRADLHVEVAVRSTVFPAAARPYGSLIRGGAENIHQSKLEPQARAAARTPSAEIPIKLPCRRTICARGKTPTPASRDARPRYHKSYLGRAESRVRRMTMTLPRTGARHLPQKKKRRTASTNTMCKTKRAMGIRREAMLAAVLIAAASLAPAAAFRHGMLPSSAPPPATSHPAQCTPSGPRVDSPSSTPFRAPAPGLLGLPHSRHLRAAQKIQVGCQRCFRGPPVARIVVATEIEISSSCQTSEDQR